MIRLCFLACWILTFSTVPLQSTQYALSGQMVTFEPVIKTPPDEILWKHNGNKVVEFNGNEETVYSPFEKRITLDWHAAVLEIKQLKHGDSGEYELDVLTKKGFDRFNFALEVIDRVAKPNILCKMNNGSSGSDKSGNEATLVCSSDSRQSQSVTFEWNQRGTTHPGPILKILLGKEYDDEVYSCTVSNGLSKEMAAFTAKDCYLVNRSAGLSDGLSATIGLIAALCVLGTTVLGVVYCKRKHKACFAKEKTKDVEHQPALDEANDHTSKPLLDRLPTIPSTQRLRPLPGMSRNNNHNRNDEETESDEDTGTGLVKRRTRKFERQQEPTETNEDKLKKTQLPVAEKPFNGNLAQNVKGEADADPHREEPEKTVLAIDHLEDHSGATQRDLQPFTSSELPESKKEEDEDTPNMAPADEHKEEKQGAIADQVTRETEEENEKKKEENESDVLREKEKSPAADEQTDISKDVGKKPGPPVAEKPPFPVNLARNSKVIEIDPHKEPMEKNGLECGRLEEHSGATKPDLQTSTASEKPESKKEEDEEAPNMAPADEHKEEKQDAKPDQVARESEEENESDVMREKEKSPITDEQTESEKEKEEDEEAPNMAPADEHKEEKQDAIADQVTGETKEENEKKKEENESDVLREKEKSPAADEQTGSENNTDKSMKTKPPVPKKSFSFKKNKEPAAVNALRENKVSDRDGLEEHSGATESDLQSSTASETPGLESNKDKSKKTPPPVSKKSFSFKKDKADVNALRENKVSDRDGLKEHSGATESDLQSSTASETPGSENNTDKSKKTKPPVPKKSFSFKKNKEPAAVNALRENKVSDRDGLKEHSGATESDLQSSTASETPELKKEADDKAKSAPEVGGSPSAAEPCSPLTQTSPKMAPKNDTGEHVDNSNSEQVIGETNEKNVGK